VRSTTLRPPSGSTKTDNMISRVVRRYKSTSNENLLRSIKKESIKDRIAPKWAKEVVTKPCHLACFQIVGSGESPMGPRSVLLFTETARHVFNPSEGVQRILQEQGPPKCMNQLASVCLTGHQWRHLGGLSGLILTADMHKANDIRLLGPKSVPAFFRAAEQFLALRGNMVIPQEGHFEDPAVKIEPVHLKLCENAPKVFPEVSPYSSWLPERSDAYSEGKLINSGGWKERQMDKAKEIMPIEQGATCYIIRVKATHGKVNFSKCAEVGVPPGPLVRELLAGRSILMEDGRVIKQADVCNPEEEEQVSLVVDCPNQHFLPSLLSSLRPSSLKPEYVFHFTPTEVMEMTAYTEWMASLGDNATHVALDGGRAHSSADALAFEEVRLWPSWALWPSTFDLSATEDDCARPLSQP